MKYLIASLLLVLFAAPAQADDDVINLPQFHCNGSGPTSNCPSQPGVGEFVLLRRALQHLNCNIQPGGANFGCGVDTDAVYSIQINQPVNCGTRVYEARRTFTTIQDGVWQWSVVPGYGAKFICFIETNEGVGCSPTVK